MQNKDKSTKHFCQLKKVCSSFLRQIKAYLLTGVIILLLSGILGALNPGFFLENIFPVMKDIATSLHSQQMFIVICRIFLQNTLVSLILLAGGFLLAIPSIAILIFNGYVIGAAISYSLLTNGFMRTLVAILPHGIFEIPAFLFALSGSLYIANCVLFRRKIEWRKIGIISSIVLSLLFIAAIIEAYLFLV